VDAVVVRELRGGQPFDPVILSVIDVGAQVLLQGPVLPFGLHICLRMVLGAHSASHSQVVADGRPDYLGQLRAPVGDYTFGKPRALEDSRAR
jgi:hypothetical protein